MKYETAKKLKDAGFPMDYELDNFTEYDKKTANIWIPLDGLIEACGDKFDALGKCKDDGMSKIVDGWIAVDENNVRAWGITPEEAVGKLWLALNKK